MKIFQKNEMKIVIFTAVKNRCMLHGRVFVMKKHRPVLASTQFDQSFYFPFHYENTPMQYTALFHGCKNVNFQMKFFDIFLIFAQNINCGYTSTHNLCFRAKKKRKKNVYTCKLHFYYIKVGCMGVYNTRTCYYDVKKRRP